MCSHRKNLKIPAKRFGGEETKGGRDGEVGRTKKRISKIAWHGCASWRALCLIRHVMVIVTSWSQNQKRLTANQLQWNLTLAVDFPNQIEIESKKIVSLWLLSKEVQSILPVFCGIPALVVFSWIVYHFDSWYVGSFKFSSANIPFLDTNQTVPSQVSKVYGVLRSGLWNWNWNCACAFCVFLFFLRHEAVAKTAEFHTRGI